MALIKCKECGKEISDSAISCPHCGYKTSHAQKVEEAKLIMYISLAVTLVCITLDIIGVILFFSGMNKLSDYGYGLFDNWSQSYRDSVVEAGEKCIIGIILLTIGFVGSILFQKNKYRLENCFKRSNGFDPYNKNLEKVLLNSSSTPSSTRKYCPHCGEVVTSNQCGMCGKEINSIKKDG